MYAKTASISGSRCFKPTLLPLFTLLRSLASRASTMLMYAFRAARTRGEFPSCVNCDGKGIRLLVKTADKRQVPSGDSRAACSHDEGGHIMHACMGARRGWAYIMHAWGQDGAGHTSCMHAWGQDWAGHTPCMHGGKTGLGIHHACMGARPGRTYLINDRCHMDISTRAGCMWAATCMMMMMCE